MHHTDDVNRLYCNSTIQIISIWRNNPTEFDVICKCKNVHCADEHNKKFMSYLAGTARS